MPTSGASHETFNQPQCCKGTQQFEGLHVQKTALQTVLRLAVTHTHVNLDATLPGTQACEVKIDC